MKIDSLAIKNYRALRNVEISFSHFACLTGENNAGKSSFLQALSLFLRGTALPETNFFDPSEEVVIAVGFPNVGDDDLSRLVEELPDAQKEERFVALPTGDGFSVSPMLPEPIYIPAVKDLHGQPASYERQTHHHFSRPQSPSQSAPAAIKSRQN